MKLALITGGCRRLGAAIAARLAADGYALALHASADPVPEKELIERLAGTQWRGFAADFANEGATAGLIDAVAAHFGRAPDLLVNNAAMFGEDRLETTSSDALLDHYRINTAAPALLAKALAARAGEGGAAIVNILDQRIAQPHGDQLSYTLSKIALAGLTRILARELAPRIRVNAVAPGLTIPTESYAPVQLNRIAGIMPLERLPDPPEIADAVVWLGEAEAVTGQIIFVDGGAHMHAWPRDFINF